MKTLLEMLAELSKRDGAQLARHESRGDMLASPRTVIFELLTQSEQDAAQAAKLMTECGYGRAMVSDDPGWSLTGDDASGWRVIVHIDMPISPHVLRCASALVLVVAHAFSMEYCGWACQMRAI